MGHQSEKYAISKFRLIEFTRILVRYALTWDALFQSNSNSGTSLATKINCSDRVFVISLVLMSADFKGTRI